MCSRVNQYIKLKVETLLNFKGHNPYFSLVLELNLTICILQHNEIIHIADRLLLLGKVDVIADPPVSWSPDEARPPDVALTSILQPPALDIVTLALAPVLLIHIVVTIPGRKSLPLPVKIGQWILNILGSDGPHPLSWHILLVGCAGLRHFRIVVEEGRHRIEAVVAVREHVIVGEVNPGMACLVILKIYILFGNKWYLQNKNCIFQ